MINRRLPTLFLLLLLSLTVQSVSAAYDNHSGHQTTGEHLKFEHAHEGEAASAAAVPAFDCHHCCHCHSSSSLYLLPEISDIQATPIQLAAFFQSAQHAAPFLANLLRPPIA